MTEPRAALAPDSDVVVVPRERIDALCRRLERLLAVHTDPRRAGSAVPVRHPLAEAEQLLQGLEQAIARDQSAPVFELLDGVLCTAPRGPVDGGRGADLHVRVVSTAMELGARVVILDLTRVTEIDDGGALQLLALVRACPRFDARAIFAGAPTHVNRRIFLVDSNLGGAQIAGSLKEALRACMPPRTG